MKVTHRIPIKCLGGKSEKGNRLDRQGPSNRKLSTDKINLQLTQSLLFIYTFQVPKRVTHYQMTSPAILEPSEEGEASFYVI